jgi:uncharacterized protein with HEPN domain
MNVERPDRVRLEHALEALREARRYAEGHSREALSEDRMRFDAILHQLTVLGEACNRLSEATRSLAPELPWRSVIGLRNVIVHEYFGIDDWTIWDIIHHDLAHFEAELDALLKRLPA